MKKSLTISQVSLALTQLPGEYQLERLATSKFGWLGSLLFIAPKGLEPIIYQGGQWCQFAMPLHRKRNQSKGGE